MLNSSFMRLRWTEIKFECVKACRGHTVQRFSVIFIYWCWQWQERKKCSHRIHCVVHGSSMINCYSNLSTSPMSGNGNFIDTYPNNVRHWIDTIREVHGIFIEANGGQHFTAMLWQTARQETWRMSNIEDLQNHSFVNAMKFVEILLCLRFAMVSVRFMKYATAQFIVALVFHAEAKVTVAILNEFNRNLQQ